MNLAQRIKQAREKAGKTQAEVAGLMGISQQAYSQYESGRRVPKPETIGRIAYALGIIPEELLGSTDFPSQDSMSILAGMGLQAVSEYHSTAMNQLQLFAEAAAKVVPAPQEVLLAAFDQLNREGQKKAVERVQELTEIPRYRAESPAQGQQQPAGPEADKDPTHE